MFIELSTIYFQVGLAVDDIKGIQEAASLKKLALQVRLIIKSVKNSVVAENRLFC